MGQPRGDGAYAPEADPRLPCDECAAGLDAIQRLRREFAENRKRH